MSTTDPREAALNEAALNLTAAEDYCPNFADRQRYVEMETRLFLARFDALCRLLGIDPAMLLKSLTAAVVNLANPVIQVSWSEPEANAIAAALDINRDRIIRELELPLVGAPTPRIIGKNPNLAAPHVKTETKT